MKTSNLAGRVQPQGGTGRSGRGCGRLCYDSGEMWFMAAKAHFSNVSVPLLTCIIVKNEGNQGHCALVVSESASAFARHLFSLVFVLGHGQHGLSAAPTLAACTCGHGTHRSLYTLMNTHFAQVREHKECACTKARMQHLFHELPHARVHLALDSRGA